MKKLILRLVIVIPILSGSIGYVLVNGATSTSTCTIAEDPTK
jgi:hypothetical protein